MSHLYFPTEILECFCIDSFKNFGFSEDESKIITDVLLTSDKMQSRKLYLKHQLQQCLMLMMEWDSWLHIKQ